MRGLDGVGSDEEAMGGLVALFACSWTRVRVDPQFCFCLRDGMLEPNQLQALMRDAFRPPESANCLRVAVAAGMRCIDSSSDIETAQPHPLLCGPPLSCHQTLGILLRCKIGLLVLTVEGKGSHRRLVAFPLAPREVDQRELWWTHCWEVESFVAGPCGHPAHWLALRGEDGSVDRWRLRDACRIARARWGATLHIRSTPGLSEKMKHPLWCVAGRAMGEKSDEGMEVLPRPTRRPVRVLVPAQGPPDPSVISWFRREHSTLFHMWLDCGRPRLQYHQTEIDKPVNFAPRLLEFVGQHLPGAIPLGCPMSAWQLGRPVDNCSVPSNWTMQPDDAVLRGVDALRDCEHEPAIYARDTREPALLGHILVSTNGAPAFRIAEGCTSHMQLLSSCHLSEGCLSLTPSEASLVTSAFMRAVDPLLRSIPVLVTRVTNGAQLDIAAHACLCPHGRVRHLDELNQASSETDRTQVTFLNGRSLQHRLDLTQHCLDLTHLPSETSIARFKLERLPTPRPPLGIFLWEAGQSVGADVGQQFATATMFTPRMGDALHIDWQLLRFLMLKREPSDGVIRAIDVPRHLLDSLGIPHLGFTASSGVPSAGCASSAVSASVHEAIMLSRAFGIYVTRRFGDDTMDDGRTVEVAWW